MSARAVLPTRHNSLLRALSTENPPSFLANRSIHNSQALLIRGSALVNPRSDKTRSIQFVEMYFGLYRLSPVHHPLGSCLARMSDAHPLLGIICFANWASGSFSRFPSSCLRARYLMEGWFFSSSQSSGVLGFTDLPAPAPSLILILG